MVNNILVEVMSKGQSEKGLSFCVGLHRVCGLWEERESLYKYHHRAFLSQTLCL